MISKVGQLRQKAKPLLIDATSCARSRLTVANGGEAPPTIDYNLKRWAALSRYATDGRLPIDNNPVGTRSGRSPSGKRTGFCRLRRASKRARCDAERLLATTPSSAGSEKSVPGCETLEALPTCRNSQIDSLLPFTAEGLQHSVS